MNPGACYACGFFMLDVVKNLRLSGSLTGLQGKKSTEADFCRLKRAKRGELLARMTVLLLLSCFVLTACGKKGSPLATLQELEKGVKSPRSLEEIQAAIKEYDDAAEAVVKAAAKVGNWYKVLGSRYVDQKMYGKALECYLAAAEFYPTNQNLHYWIGICSGTMAASSYNDERKSYIETAEKAYRRAIDIDDRFTRALYALGVLYVFELDRCEDAIPLLEKLLTIDKKHTDARFVLARAYFVTSQTDKAAALYDLIIADTKDSAKKAEARANRDFILRGAGG